MAVTHFDSNLNAPTLFTLQAWLTKVYYALDPELYNCGLTTLAWKGRKIISTAKLVEINVIVRKLRFIIKCYNISSVDTN